MSPTLLIVEESLRDLKAHWFEYIKTTSAAATANGHQTFVVCHQDSVQEIRQSFVCFPVFKHARYLDDNSQLPGDRYYGFILHSWRCLRVLWPLLNQSPRYDRAFAPTVLVHHLLAWWLIMSFHPRRPQHLTLFFVTNPGIWDVNQQQGALRASLSTKIQGWLIQRLKRLVAQGQVTLAVETQGAQKEFEALSHLPFVLMTHPVPPLSDPSAQPQSVCTPLPACEKIKSVHFACYGFARYEKGSDLFQSAIGTILDEQPHFAHRFSIQWIDPFVLPTGEWCRADTLRSHHQVTLIDHPLDSESYQKKLKTVNCMVLPYRNSSYYARVSRIAVEAIYLGIPIIYTHGGWLAETVEAFGAGIGIQDESVSELMEAIEQMTVDYAHYRQAALLSVNKAKHYFSAANFYEQLLAK